MEQLQKYPKKTGPLDSSLDFYKFFEQYVFGCFPEELQNPDTLEDFEVPILKAPRYDPFIEQLLQEDINFICDLDDPKGIITLSDPILREIERQWHYLQDAPNVAQAFIQIFLHHNHQIIFVSRRRKMILKTPLISALLFARDDLNIKITESIKYVISPSEMKGLLSPWAKFWEAVTWGRHITDSQPKGIGEFHWYPVIEIRVDFLFGIMLDLATTNSVWRSVVLEYWDYSSDRNICEFLPIYAGRPVIQNLFKDQLDADFIIRKDEHSIDSFFIVKEWLAIINKQTVLSRTQKTALDGENVNFPILKKGHKSNPLAFPVNPLRLENTSIEETEMWETLTPSVILNDKDVPLEDELELPREFKIQDKGKRVVKMRSLFSSMTQYRIPAARDFIRFYRQNFHVILQLEEYFGGWMLFRDRKNHTQIIVRIKSMNATLRGYYAGIRGYFSIFFTNTKNSTQFLVKPQEQIRQDTTSSLQRLNRAWLTEAGVYTSVLTVNSYITQLRNSFQLNVNFLFGDILTNDYLLFHRENNPGMWLEVKELWWYRFPSRKYERPFIGPIFQRFLAHKNRQTAGVSKNHPLVVMLNQQHPEKKQLDEKIDQAMQEYAAERELYLGLTSNPSNADNSNVSENPDNKELLEPNFEMESE